MKLQGKIRLWFFAGMLLELLIGGSPIVFAQSADWYQWGGATRNFKSPAKGLATNWPATGPKKLWQRALGDGYSAIAATDGKLFTMYRKGETEIVAALDAASGKTLWEYAYSAPFTKDYDMSNGEGPHATPLVIGNLIFTAGATSKFHCLNKQTGKPVWSHDLIKEFNGTTRVNGYSCSPLAYKHMVIMQVGGQGSAIIAFNQKDGAVVWKKHDFKNSTSSPLIINVGGEEQLIAFMFDDIVGVNPTTGDLLWSYKHTTDFGLNTSTPVWGDDDLLFVSSGYNGGSRVIKLIKNGAKTTPEEVWFSRSMRIHFSNCIRLGDIVYGSSGDFGPAFFTAVNVKTGKVLWRDRNIARSSFIYADGHFILLDEDGNLSLATPTDQGVNVLSKVSLTSTNSWTVPTLIGTTLYVRDRKNIMALDLK
ncbi:MAG: PQQ-binding-like beta-propeller repeat protein [Acidobacteriota bacterium]